MSMLRIDRVVQHGVERDMRFRVVDALGRGGFGEAHEVVHVDEDDIEADPMCLKITNDDLTWHGEAYFMRLLQGDSHALQIYDAFPVQVGEGSAARTRFCITMELLRGRSVAGVCETSEELPWSEPRVTRQIRYLLRTVSTLHEPQRLTETSHQETRTLSQGLRSSSATSGSSLPPSSSPGCAPSGSTTRPLGLLI